MGKCCCAMGCSNRFYKGCGLHFYHFPVDTDRLNCWIAAVNRKDWQSTEYTWICNRHFVGGRKIDDPTSPAFVPTKLLRQKYKILSSTLPINLIMCEAEEEHSIIDKIVTVCSALCNLCESVVPLISMVFDFPFP